MGYSKPSINHSYTTFQPKSLTWEQRFPRSPGSPGSPNSGGCSTKHDASQSNLRPWALDPLDPKDSCGCVFMLLQKHQKDIGLTMSPI